jgi:hypothetical protein
MKSSTTAVASVLLFSLCATSLWSSDADVLRERAKAMQRASEQLAKQGRQEEATKLGREAKELLQAAQEHATKEPKPRKELLVDKEAPSARQQKQAAKEPKPRKGEMQELERRLKGLAEKEEELKKAGNKEGLTELQQHRVAIERELKGLREHLKRQPAAQADAKSSLEVEAELDDAARRIKHIRVAAENLHAAGMHDVAEELTKRAEAMQQEFQETRERMANIRTEKGAAIGAEPNSALLEELRRDVHQLRSELKELREELKRRP